MRIRLSTDKMKKVDWAEEDEDKRSQLKNIKNVFSLISISELKLFLEKIVEMKFEWVWII